MGTKYLLSVQKNLQKKKGLHHKQDNLQNKYHYKKINTLKVKKNQNENNQCITLPLSLCRLCELILISIL
jgi:hypothetical protein